MICYLPALRVVTVSGVAAWLLWHKAIMHILGVAGMVLEITVAAAGAVALAVAVIWLTREIQRRRARAGGCTGCRFRCQLAMTGPAAPGRRAPARQRLVTVPRAVTRPAAGTVPRPVAVASARAAGTAVDQRAS
jgi:hypothetical protein